MQQSNSNSVSSAVSPRQTRCPKGHHHDPWPATGTFSIQSCEVSCSFCDAKPFKDATVLRKHVRRHLNRGDVWSTLLSGTNGRPKIEEHAPLSLRRTSYETFPIRGLSPLSQPQADMGFVPDTDPRMGITEAPFPDLGALPQDLFLSSNNTDPLDFLNAMDPVLNVASATMDSFPESLLASYETNGNEIPMEFNDLASLQSGGGDQFPQHATPFNDFEGLEEPWATTHSTALNSLTTRELSYPRNFQKPFCYVDIEQLRWKVQAAWNAWSYEESNSFRYMRNMVNRQNECCIFEAGTTIILAWNHRVTFSGVEMCSELCDKIRSENGEIQFPLYPAERRYRSSLRPILLLIKEKHGPVYTIWKLSGALGILVACLKRSSMRRATKDPLRKIAYYEDPKPIHEIFTRLRLRKETVPVRD